MSFRRAPDAKRPAESSGVLPSSPHTPRRSEAAILADELAKSAGQINWPRLPELKEFGQMAEMVLSASGPSSTRSYRKGRPDGLAYCVRSWMQNRLPRKWRRKNPSRTGRSMFSERSELAHLSAALESFSAPDRKLSTFFRRPYVKARKRRRPTRHFGAEAGGIPMGPP